MSANVDPHILDKTELIDLVISVSAMYLVHLGLFNTCAIIFARSVMYLTSRSNCSWQFQCQITRLVPTQWCPDQDVYSLNTLSSMSVLALLFLQHIFEKFHRYHKGCLYKNIIIIDFILSLLWMKLLCLWPVKWKLL